MYGIGVGADLRDAANNLVVAMPGILVVEDDENLNRVITFSLKKSGYEVFSAESVEKAKRIASNHNVDVTICDVNLPDGNGLEFVRDVYKRQRYLLST